MQEFEGRWGLFFNYLSRWKQLVLKKPKTWMCLSKLFYIIAENI